jgi:hypothetical protein
MTLWHCLHSKFLQPSTVASVIRRKGSTHFLRATGTGYVSGARRSATQYTKTLSRQRTDYKGSGNKSHRAFLICGAYFAWFGSSAFNQAKALEKLDIEEDDELLGDPFDSTLNTTPPPIEPPKLQAVVQNKVVNLEQVNGNHRNVLLYETEPSFFRKC